MQTPNLKEDPYILVEFAGTRKLILKEKLQEAEAMAEHMRQWAAKAGLSPKEIEQMYTLKIVKDAP